MTITLQEITCQLCDHTHFTFEDTPGLSMPFPEEESSLTLENCLSRHFKACSTVKGYYCRKCKKENDSLRIVTIWKKPEVLALHLKKFKQTNGQYLESKDAISFKMELEFDYLNFHSPGNYSDITSNIIIENKNKYWLYGYISHHGTSKSGHYTA